MKRIKLFCGLLLLFGFGFSANAFANHGHFHHGHFHHGAHVGVVIGAPLWWWSGPGYYTPYYGDPYYPPVAAVPSQPPVYIEQSQADSSSSPSPSDYWYYCNKPDGYYPYVKQCPGGWQKVLPSSSSRY
jgi:hypothetical protein